MIEEDTSIDLGPHTDTALIFTNCYHTLDTGISMDSYSLKPQHPHCDVDVSIPGD